jgi:predicted nucleic acid-binding protein
VNLVDSSGWLEFLANAPGADFFAPAIEEVDRLLVPQICILEVVRLIHRQRGEEAAIRILTQMKQGRVVVLTDSIILSAARLAQEHRLPLADSVILATARAYGAVVWTQDADFEGLDGVKYTPKRHFRSS